MAQDTDPGIGVGVIVGGGDLSTLSGPLTTSKLCVQYQRSLEILNIDHMPGAYGQIVAGTCKLTWKQYQRDGWINALIRSEQHIRRDLGMALCPMEICDEIHELTDSIKVRQSPIAYLGRKTWSDWTETGLVYDGDDAHLILCESDLGVDVEPERVQFSYTDDVLQQYTGPQVIQVPIVTDSPVCDPEPGWRFTWPKHQMVYPYVDGTQISGSDDYVQIVRWRVSTVESESAGSLVGICDCDCCSSNPTITLSIADASEGIICVDDCGNGPVQGCYCSNRRVKINYAAAYSCTDYLDPNIEEAIVLLALAKAARTPIKPCGCDNTWIDYMLETDPTAGSEFATKLRYGSTRAGLEVLRLLMSIEKRPHFNEPGIQMGGMLTKRKIKKGRYRSVLRG